MRRIVVITILLTGCPRDETPRNRTTPRSLTQLVAAFERTARQPLAEAIKCRRLRDALLSVGARPHALGAVDGVELPKLRSTEALLSFFEQGGVLYRFLRVGDRDVKLAPLASRSIDPLLIHARDVLELGELNELDPLWRDLRRLYNRLVGDAEVHLAEVQELVVSADGLLRFLPLHVLLGPKERFVGARWRTRHLPCLALARRSKRSAVGAEVFLPSFGGTTKTPSEGAVREGEIVAGEFDRTKRWVGEHATRKRFVEALATSRVVHFAGHGLQSEILFGTESLTLAEATRKPIRAERVVLASCATAYTARFRDGKRIVARTNFAEALLAAGARSVIAASWTVKDEESARQMKILYKEGLPEVYRDRIANIRPPHPRYWGAYAEYGDRIRVSR